MRMPPDKFATPISDPTDVYVVCSASSAASSTRSSKAAWSGGLPAAEAPVVEEVALRPSRNPRVPNTYPTPHTLAAGRAAGTPGVAGLPRRAAVTRDAYPRISARRSSTSETTTSSGTGRSTAHWTPPLVTL